MPFDIISTCGGFLLGAATGATGTYFAYKYTDRRREQEAAHTAKKQFLAIKAQMSDLLAEMKADLAGEGHGHVREFFVLPNRHVMLGGSEKPRFIYYEDAHDNLRGKLDILDNAGYIFEVPHGNAPIYRMREAFVHLLADYA